MTITINKTVKLKQIMGGSTRLILSVMFCIAVILVAVIQHFKPLSSSQHQVGADVEWPMYGGDANEQRFSPLSSINIDNVNTLEMAWYYNLQEGRGVEATPLMVDGKLFVTSAWSVVHALDAKTGEELWVYDPKADRVIGALSCCDAVNRGVAYLEGKIFSAAIDGRLFALDMNTGELLWETQTLDVEGPYVITGAPRAAKGLVFIGNSGADFAVRGYVGAYDAETGEKVWRFYTVPGNPAAGADNEASDSVLKMMSDTWTGEWWRNGGGGTVWDSITYDVELDRIYIGVGNGAPWNQQVRSPGGGDNLFLASIVALDRATGKYLWHFQTTPGETWDITATQSMILTTLSIDGRDRKVLMQAPKNGFYYVLDRESGEFISAGGLVPMLKTADTPKGQPISWAYGVDKKTGRPLENKEARYLDGKPVRVHPVGPGAHGWQPMSFSPQTGYAYIPIQDFTQTFSSDLDYKQGPPPLRTSGHVEPIGLPKDKALRKRLATITPSRLVAWDPVTQKEAWRVKHEHVASGGVLTTAGGLVFQGQAGGEFAAYNAKDGSKLWQFDAQAAAQGGAISYQIDGEQYIAIAVGNGGASYLAAALFVPEKPAPYIGRVIVFKLGEPSAKQQLPPVDRIIAPIPAPPVFESVTPEQLLLGNKTYAAYCAACHGFSVVSGHVVPDLRRSPIIQSAQAFELVVKGGILENRGMPNFGERISSEELEAIRAYIADEAEFTRSAQ